MKKKMGLCQIKNIRNGTRKDSKNLNRVRILMELIRGIKKMSKELKGNLIRDIPDGEMLKDKVAEGDLLVSEAPTGNPLWKKKKKLNEDDDADRILNEAL